MSSSTSTTPNRRKRSSDENKTRRLSLLASGYSSLGTRSAQEDRFFILQTSRTTILCVIDGHRGSTSANILCKHLGRKILTRLNTQPPKDALHDSICDLEHKCIIGTKYNRSFDGATIAVLLCHDSTFFVAHVGDCRVVLCDHDGQVVHKTIDHSVKTNAIERQRLINSDGVVIRGRLMGKNNNDLTISRAIGDRDFKSTSQQALIHVPEVNELDKNQVQPGHVIIVHSDGLSDINDFDETDMMNMIKPSEFNRKSAASNIVKEGMMYQERDNSTAIVGLVVHGNDERLLAINEGRGQFKGFDHVSAWITSHHHNDGYGEESTQSKSLKVKSALSNVWNRALRKVTQR